MIKNKLKRLAAGVAAFMLAFSMTACGGKKDDKKSGDDATEVKTEATGNSGEEVTEDGGNSIDELGKITSNEYAILMGNGFNLGNTME